VVAIASVFGSGALGCAAPLPPPVKTTLVAGPSPARPGPDPRGPKSAHPEALGRLLDAESGVRVDQRQTISFELPDAGAWTHVRYWGLTTLAGYRYGADHHVALAAFSFTPPALPATVDGCAERFERWGRDRAQTFDVEVGAPRIDVVKWRGGEAPAKIFVLDARMRSILGTKRYAAAYAVYPAWNDACFVLGFAVPERDAPEAARKLRDRLVRDALPSLTVRGGAGAVALEAKSDVE
jgi:hypothetical protein